MPSMHAFVSNIGCNIQLFAKSFRSCIRNYIIDAATKAFSVILLRVSDIADKRAFSSHQIKRIDRSMTD
jgi:hypothetical protein